MNSSNFLPSSEPRARSARIMSPVETCGMPITWASRIACVPFPAPGGPNRMMSMLAAPPTNPGALGPGEALVVPRDQVRFDLLNEIERDAHDDHDRGAAEVERHLEL